MKNRKINFLKLGILLFGISLSLWNCEKENYSETTFNDPFKIEAKTVSFKQAKKSTSFK